MNANLKATQYGWQDKISHHSQIGGIETSVLDNGAGRGTRIAWFNTGSGLRFKVVIDRAMDIADAFFNQHSLTWISSVAIVAPQTFSDRGIGWLRTFGGGLLTTCGLTHVGGPESDEYGERGIHDRISNLPAEIESIIQPNLQQGQLEMSMTGKVYQVQVFGPVLELRRTISCTIGQSTIRIHDVVTNRYNSPTPHMLLYHLNLGWPLADVGAEILWKGSWQSREGQAKARIFREGHSFRTCSAPLEEHRGGGEEAAFIDISPDADGQCTCGLHNHKIGLALALHYQKAQLPWMTNWQHWGMGEYVTGLEPGTHPPIGQAEARRQLTLIHLAPGESRTYSLTLEVLDDPGKMKALLNNTNQPY